MSDLLKKYGVPAEEHQEDPAVNEPKQDLLAKYGVPKPRTEEQVNYDAAPSAPGAAVPVLALADLFTAGHSDEIAGAMHNPKGALKAILGHSEKEDQDVADYRRAQVEMENFKNKAKKESPKTFYGTAIPGAIGAGIATGGTSLIPTILAGAATGAGESDAKLSEREYGKYAKDAGFGGAVSGLTHIALGKVGKFLKGKSKPAEEVASAVSQSEAVEPASDSILKTGQRYAKELLGKAKPAENADEISSAVKEISGKSAPGYMLTKDKPTNILADTLLKSPTIGGARTRAEVEPIYKGLENFGKQVAEHASDASAYQTGKDVGRGIGDRFKAMIAPAEEVYGQLETKFKDVPLEKRSFKTAMTKLRGQAQLDPTGSSNRLLDGIEKVFMGAADESGAVVGGVNDVAQLRTLRTNLGSYLNGTSSTAEKKIVGELYGVLTRERDRSIAKMLFAGEHGLQDGSPVSGKAVLRQLKGADKTYRNAVSTTADALGVEGTNKTAASTAIRQYLSDTPPETLVKDLFNRNNYDQLLKVKNLAPEQFDMLRRRAITDLIDKSSSNGNLDAGRLVRNLQKYGPEVQQLMLGELASKGKSAQTVLGALPKDFNPSHTAHASKWTNVFSPSWYGENATSLAQRAALQKKVPSIPDLRGALKGSSPVSTGGGARVIEKLRNSTGGTRFVTPLANALQRGEANFAATYYLLSSQNPDFRKAIGEEK